MAAMSMLLMTLDDSDDAIEQLQSVTRHPYRVIKDLLISSEAISF